MNLLHRTIGPVIFLFAATITQAEQIIFTEIMANPSGTKPEYVEIKNLQNS